MNKVVVFIALFAQASSPLLRQSPRKLFSAMKHQMKVFGKTMWEFTTHLSPASFMRRLAKEEYVSQVTVSHHLDRRCSVNSVFKLPPQLKFVFLLICSFPPHCDLLLGSLLLVGLTIETITYWEAWPRPCITEPAREVMDVLCSC